MIFECGELVLKLSIQAKSLEAVIWNWYKKSLKDLKFLREHLWNFTKNVQ